MMAQADYNRNKPLVANGTVTQQDMMRTPRAMSGRPGSSAGVARRPFMRFAWHSVCRPQPERANRPQVPSGPESEFFLRSRGASQADPSALAGVSQFVQPNSAGDGRRFLQAHPGGDIDQIYAGIIERMRRP